MEAVMSIRLASNSVLIKRQGVMGFKLSCSVGALAVLGVIFAGGSRSYAGVAYAHFGQEDGQKAAIVQSMPADLPRFDLGADPVSLNHQSNELESVSPGATGATGSSADSPAKPWIAKWDTGSAEESAGSANLRSAKPAPADEDSDSLQARPLAIPTPSAWSAGMVGLLGLGLARLAYRARTVRRNYR